MENNSQQIQNLFDEAGKNSNLYLIYYSVIFILFGTLSKTGQSIICAPHYLVIEIVGNVDSGIDGVAI